MVAVHDHQVDTERGPRAAPCADTQQDGRTLLYHEDALASELPALLRAADRARYACEELRARLNDYGLRGDRLDPTCEAFADTENFVEGVRDALAAGPLEVEDGRRFRNAMSELRRNLERQAESFRNVRIDPAFDRSRAMDDMMNVAAALSALSSAIDASGHFSRAFGAVSLLTEAASVLSTAAFAGGVLLLVLERYHRELERASTAQKASADSK